MRKLHCNTPLGPIQHSTLPLAGGKTQESKRRTQDHSGKERIAGKTAEWEAVRALEIQGTVAATIEAKCFPEGEIGKYGCTGKGFGMQLQEVKVIEREILLRLDGMDGEKGGCERCRCVRAIKGQLL